MQISLHGKNIGLTEAIHDYVEKRVGNLEKLLRRMEEGGEEAKVRFEIAKGSHHKKGEVFHADCSISIKGRDFYASVDEADLYAAIDAVKESLFNEIERAKDRRQTMFHRGARSVKKMLKGLSKRNPFTSKY
jgi:putative sigma-54 modulation protein